MNHTREQRQRARTERRPDVVNRLFEVVIAVKDFDAAVKKYSDVLGVKPIFVKEERMPTPGDSCATFPIGDIVISLVSPKKPGTAISRYLDSRGEGVCQIAFEVADINETMRELGGQGIKWASEAPTRYGYGWLNFALPKSMHGVLTGFAQHDEGYMERVLRGE